ncbi:hypothetical protein D1872_247600 [compost metagenome]
MHDAISNEFSIFQTRNHREDPLLLTPFEMCLESDQIVQRTCRIVLTQLDNRMRQRPRMRVHQSYRLHRAEQSRLLPALHHNLDWHAALKIDFLLELLQLCNFSSDKCIIECIEFSFVHRTVQIRGFTFIIARSQIHLAHIDRILLDNWCSCIIEIEIFLSCQLLDLLR